MGKRQHLEIGTGNGKPVSLARASSQSENHSKTNKMLNDRQGKSKLISIRVEQSSEGENHIILFIPA
jgi:hypothetical protein